MPPKLRVYLRDILSSCEAIAEYVDGKSLEDYLTSRMLRSAVERELILIGEAVNQATKLEPALAQTLSDARRIIDFRNLAVHAYARLRADRFWEIATQHAPNLLEEARAELMRLEQTL